ncbi:hypothetical protein O181_014311 [Austropuccinia psidii MF-1]|uniref:Phosphoribulokinase/uridine kinase domain-containing protein n=1 Tax=Austropuccinia psidii MF-1 TaxID=1389203 RepID=A0A9Q3GP15_9BASI|nr:hypothetical protein [Austropuccinia psidii MF-1]
MGGIIRKRSVLDTFEDPVEAHRRRGAPHTFDSKFYRKFIKSLLEPTSSETLFAPSFSHTAKDPVLDAIPILPNHKIIIIEGLYTSLQEGEDWKMASSLIHLSILVNVSPQLSRQRLIQRHVSSGICSDSQQAAERVDFNDQPNGEYLLSHLRVPDLVIESVEDASITLETP